MENMPPRPLFVNGNGTHKKNNNNNQLRWNNREQKERKKQPDRTHPEGAH